MSLLDKLDALPFFEARCEPLRPRFHLLFNTRGASQVTLRVHHRDSNWLWVEELGFLPPGPVDADLDVPGLPEGTWVIEALFHDTSYSSALGSPIGASYVATATGSFHRAGRTAQRSA